MFTFNQLDTLGKTEKNRLARVDVESRCYRNDPCTHFWWRDAIRVGVSYVPCVVDSRFDHCGRLRPGRVQIRQTTCDAFAHARVIHAISITLMTDFSDLQVPSTNSILNPTPDIFCRYDFLRWNVFHANVCPLCAIDSAKF